ncbi:Hyaluronan synthase [Megamonas hypermegale]|uniref:Hyaluronan synthase n=1 Tax=Megamonas hypermegale TaxID=158847 RepID=A0A239U6U1_9FIRM|nr:glycosyltransferase family 2 protein [Megamonas hypermegale]SNV05615.1 Hyaluronan synthase [Megamonas hypermegale]
MKISVIIPAYNGEKYIKRCINSIKKQTFYNWEIILIDDGSKDKTGIICDAYALEDNRIKVIHKANGGASSARNLGIDKATGDYITFIDCDDWVEEDFFEKAVDFFAKNFVDILITGFVFDKNRVSRNMFKGKNKEIIGINKARKEFFLRDKFSWEVCAKFYKKEILSKIKFDIKLKIGEDMLFFWQVLNSVEKIGYLPLYKYHYDISASKTMTSKFSVKWFHGLKVKRNIYNQVKNISKEMELLSKIVVVVEMVTLAKKAYDIDNYKSKRIIKYLQKGIRKNIYLSILYPKSNIMTLRQRLGIIYFSLPYKLCILGRNFLK